MLTKFTPSPLATAIGIGAYSVPEVARLLEMAPVNIRRWLCGYTFRRSDTVTTMPPLWATQFPPQNGHLELGFRDLIELRFVYAFWRAGVGLKTIRACMEAARTLTGDDRPFSTRRFKTDGRALYLESASKSDDANLLEVKHQQYVIRNVIERSFKDLDLERDAVVRWRPFQGKDSIVLDPERAFGQPIARESGIPTVTLDQAVDAEGSIERVARIFEIAPGVVRDAQRFEHTLRAA